MLIHTELVGVEVGVGVGDGDDDVRSRYEIYDEKIQRTDRSEQVTWSTNAYESCGLGVAMTQQASPVSKVFGRLGIRGWLHVCKVLTSYWHGEMLASIGSIRQHDHQTDVFEHLPIFRKTRRVSGFLQRVRYQIRPPKRDLDKGQNDPTASW